MPKALFDGVGAERGRLWCSVAAMMFVLYGIEYISEGKEQWSVFCCI